MKAVSSCGVGIAVEEFRNALAQLNAVRQAGQRVVVRQIAHPRIGQPLLGDVGIGVHEPAVRQRMAAHFDDRAVVARGLELACPVPRGCRGADLPRGR